MDKIFVTKIQHAVSCHSHRTTTSYILQGLQQFLPHLLVLGAYRMIPKYCWKKLQNL